MSEIQLEKSNSTQFETHQMSKRFPILLLCYDFPPNDGIGGRRWAKLAKSLAKKGHDIHVVKASMQIQQTANSPWTKDVTHEHIFIHEIKQQYPDAIQNPAPSIVGKIKTRLAILKQRLLTKGTPFDKAVGMKKTVLEKSSELIAKHDINHVIATGAPFDLLYYASLLKEANPSLKLMCDYRDMWIKSKGYGMGGLSPKRFNEEKRKQEFIFNRADVITCPNPFLLQEIKDTASQEAASKPKLQTLAHFLDLDDHKSSPIESDSSEKIILTYGGTVYWKMEEYLILLSKAMTQLQTQRPDLYKAFEFRMYSDAHMYCEHIFTNHSNVSVHPPIGKRIFDELHISSGVVIALGESYKNYLTTKFYDYLSCGKPYIYIGPKGYASEQIEKMKLGRVWDETVEGLISILEDLRSGKIEFEGESFISGNTSDQRAEEIIRLLEA